MQIDLETLLGALVALFAAYKSLCWLLDRYQVGAKRKEHAALMMATRNSMREIIRMNHHQHVVMDGWIDEQELEHIEHVYESYHALGGNGTANRWIEELRGLPRKEKSNE